MAPENHWLSRYGDEDHQNLWVYECPKCDNVQSLERKPFLTPRCADHGKMDLVKRPGA